MCCFKIENEKRNEKPLMRIKKAEEQRGQSDRIEIEKITLTIAKMGES